MQNIFARFCKLHIVIHCVHGEEGNKKRTDVQISSSLGTFWIYLFLLILAIIQRIGFFCAIFRHMCHSCPPTHTHTSFPPFPARYIDLVLILDVKGLIIREGTYGLHVSELISTEQELELRFSYSKGISKEKKLPPSTYPAKIETDE